MVSEKDVFHQKLHDAEKAREDQWARDRDQKLLEKLREHLAKREKSIEHDLKLVAELRSEMMPGIAPCPKCKQEMVERTEHGLTFKACPANDGVWLDRATFDRLIEKLSK
jgi:hypothetical protein